ncbi:hypothetical protein Patl1_34544 [Pistacia atlantica]|uniref:Uncharacterized protein n=1 Tax=Pistacia atlantica TaxID=434234 RepID=A0ACC0ZQG6_9ROSI|nr:hypothetical protein Patl1_34544 [Pistacia atlantica]
MAEQIGVTKPAASFEYELLEGDPDHVRTVVATPSQAKPWFEPDSLKLKHRIGRGPFGDVWLATHHQSADDFDEYHEVAVKMLHPLKEDCTKTFIDKFGELFLKFRELPGVCWLHGISVINGKVCIAMKFYEGSVGDRIAQLKGGKLPLPDILRCYIYLLEVYNLLYFFSPYYFSKLKMGIGKGCALIDIRLYDCCACLAQSLLSIKQCISSEDANVYRYGIQLSKGILGLHSIGLLVLNLKPSNFLLNENDQLILGDLGLPYLLLGFPLSDSDVALRLGTPNYMAPEQWEPEVRGPISLETDSWGFGCSIVEMLTGVQPWFGKSIDEIYHSVVIKQEKPYIPSGLPPAMENVLKGCFEYDLRNRPLMADILHVFESSQNAVYSDGEWSGIGSRVLMEKPGVKGYTSWYLLKDHLQVGDSVRSRKPLNGRRPQRMDVPEGTVVGLDTDTERSGFVLVKIPSMHNPLKVQESTLERVSSGFAVGDWVQLKDENNKHSTVGILHSVQRDGRVAAGFIGLETLWTGNASEIQMAKAYYVGQFVRLKANVFTPRFEWPLKSEGEWATGRISQVLPNGCLIVGFPGRFVFGQESNNSLADPAEVELVSFETCPGMVEKYQHIEDYHWSVRPLAIALSLFTAMKFGLFVGRSVSSKLKKRRSSTRGDSQDGPAGSNAAWLPSPVANIIFREGNPPTAAAR